MPLFNGRFISKKSSLRRIPSNHITDDKLFDSSTGERIIKLNLSNQEIIFNNGDWIPESGPGASTHKSVKNLEKKVQQLQEENNMLKLKYTLVLNMLTQVTAESHIQERELNKLKRK